jgi:hypothetical protein
MGERRGAYRVLVEHEGKRSIGRPRRNNSKKDLLEGGWGWCMDWINLAQDRDRWRELENKVMNLRVL